MTASNKSPVFSGGGYLSETKLIYKSSFLIPVSILIVFFIIPVLSIFKNISAADLSMVLQNKYYRSVIVFTFVQAAVSMVSALIIGLPGAWIMSHLEFKGKRFINSITTVPFVMPSVLVVLGFVLCFGNSGIINRLLMQLAGTETPPLKILYSFKAIILAHTFYNFPISLRLVSSAWRKIGANRIEAAESLGAGRIRIFLTVILPSLLPSIIAAASLIFIFCFMSFAVILVLGGGPEFSTIEVTIYRLARINLDIGAAASLALIGAALTTVFTYAYIKFQKLATVAEEPENLLPLKKPGSLDRLSRFLLFLYLLLIALLILGPLAAVIFRSFQARTGWSGELNFSLKYYLSIISSENLIKSIVNSIFIALTSMLIAVPTGLIASYFTARGLIRFTEAAETLFMLPMGVSAVVIGLGYYSLLSMLPKDFDNRSLLIISAHSLIALPFVVRTLSTGLKSINKSLLEASGTLGSGFFRTLFKIELPLLKGSLISAAAFAFCISAGEINAALILTDGSYSTIPISIYRLISSYNFFGACAMGSVLMLICGTAFYLIDRYGGSNIF